MEPNGCPGRDAARRTRRRAGTHGDASALGPGSANGLRECASDDRLSSAKRRSTASGTREMCCRRTQVICPSGVFLTRVSIPLCKNISLHPSGKSSLQLLPSHPTRGAYHDRHERGVECGGRGSVLRATGLQGRSMRFVSDRQHADERCCSVRRNRVVLTPRRWCQGCGCWVGPTGRGCNASPQATVAKQPGHRGDHVISRKTIACGNAG